ncbi:MAG: hypothetical protein JWO85_1238 [Candidatus Eremiobacteraeota bacterium]|nr:hypothetical protein [Candidatus Eremiobacteraeota bacterium]
MAPRRRACLSGKTSVRDDSGVALRVRRVSPIRLRVERHTRRTDEIPYLGQRPRTLNHRLLLRYERRRRADRPERPQLSRLRSGTARSGTARAGTARTEPARAGLRRGSSAAGAPLCRVGVVRALRCGSCGDDLVRLRRTAGPRSAPVRSSYTGLPDVVPRLFFRHDAALASERRGESRFSSLLLEDDVLRD